MGRDFVGPPAPPKPSPSDFVGPPAPPKPSPSSSTTTTTRGGGGGMSTRGSPSIDPKTGRVVYVDTSKAIEQFTKPTPPPRGGGMSTRGSPSIDPKTGRVVYVDTSKAIEQFTKPSRATTKRGEVSTRDIIPTKDVRKEIKKFDRTKRYEQAREEREREREILKIEKEREKERDIEKEIERIEKAKERIVEHGGRVESKELVNKKGEKVIHTTTIVDKIEHGKKIKERVFETRNLETGKTTTKTYKYDRKAGKVKLTGGVTRTEPTVEPSKIDFVGPPDPSKIIPTGDIRREMRKLEREKEPYRLMKEEVKNIFFEPLPSTIEPMEKKKGLERLQQILLQKQAELETKRIRGEETMVTGITEFGLGLGSGAIENVLFVKKVITKPVETGKELVEGVSFLSKKIITGEGLPEVGEALRARPSFVLGAIAIEPIIGLGVGKAVVAAGRRIPRLRYGGLTPIQFEKAIKKVTPELKKLGEAEVKWVADSQKAPGEIILKGIQELPKKAVREFTLKGVLRKVGKEIEFMPTAKAVEKLKIQLPRIRKKPVTYEATGFFEAGAKGGAIKIRDIGEIGWYKQITIGKTVPKVQTFALYKGVYRKALKKQLKKHITRDGEIVIDIGIKDVFKLDPEKYIKRAKIGKEVYPGIKVTEIPEEVFLTLGKKEVGLTIVKPKKVPEGIFVRKIPKPDIVYDKVIKKMKPWDLGKQIEVLKQPTIIPTPPVPKLKIPTPPKVVTSPPTPYMVGGMGLKVLPAPSYAPVEVIDIPPRYLDAQVKPVLMDSKTDVSQEVLTKLEFKPALKERIKIKEKIREKQKQIGRLDLDIKTKLEFKPSLKERVKIKEKVVTRIREKVGLKFAQKFKLKVTPMATVVPPKPKLPKLPKLPKPKIIPKLPTPSKVLLGVLAKKGKFKVKVRKGGKDIKIGEARTRTEAKELLLKRLKTTLRASGYVEVEGRRIDLGFLGEGFRKSKKEPKRVVEIRQKRIKRKGISFEAKEIQFFRGEARGKKRNSWRF